MESILENNLTTVEEFLSTIPSRVQTQASFAFKWDEFKEILLDKKVQDRFFNNFLNGFGLSLHMFNWTFQHKKVLDAGTGTGWLIQHFIGLDAEVWAIDNSDSIQIAKQYFSYPFAHILKTDMTTFNEQKDFDYIIANGTLHHTKNIENTLDHLSTLLKTNGELWAYIYCQKQPIREFLDTEIRKQTTNMPFNECLEFCRVMTNVGREISKLNVTVDGLPLQRWIYWNVMKCYWNPDLEYKYSLLTNFDWYSPKLASRHTLAEVVQYALNSGLALTYLKTIPSGFYVKLRAHL